MDFHNKNLGKLGEDLASDFLRKKGYKILERNFRNKWGEMDLICKDGEVFVFVEVKTRMGEQFGLPEDAINKNKLRRLIKNATAYASSNNINNYRIDAVCMILDERELGMIKTINHYENITI